MFMEGAKMNSHNKLQNNENDDDETMNKDEAIKVKIIDNSDF